MNARPKIGAVASAAIFLATLAAPNAGAQEKSDPASTLSSVLIAACRANAEQFSSYLTAENEAAFRALPVEQQSAFLKRLALADDPGRPLISSDPQNRIVLRCVSQGATVEFRFGDAHARENLAFIPVTVVDGQQTQFGLVREGGQWRLLSLGLVLLDVPQLSKQWAESSLAASEDSANGALRDLAEAIQAYRRAYGKLPDSLAQLGPAPKDQISPEQASLVDEHMATGSAGGYQFRYRIVNGPSEDDPSFEVTATPAEYGKTGRRSFLLDAAGKIRGGDRRGAMATADDPEVAPAP
jgi:type II secretory pathway pseudopilin PulG